MADEPPRFGTKTFDVHTTTKESPISTDGARCGPMIYTRRDHTTITIDDDDAPIDRRQSPASTNDVQRGALYGKVRSPSESFLSEFRPEGVADNMLVGEISVTRSSVVTGACIVNVIEVCAISIS